MLVATDGRAFVSPAGGVRRYARELFAAVARSAPAVSVIGLGGDPAQFPAGLKAMPLDQRFPTNFGWVVGSLPRGYRAAGAGVFHAPAYVMPLWNVHPAVLTIHDVSYERHPEWYPYRRDPLRRWFYRRSALAADAIVTDSEFSRREIAEAYDINPLRIRTIPLGVGPEFQPMAVEGDPAPGVTRPYVLHVGDLHPRRNLEVLLRAVGRVRSRSRSDLTLVLAGVDRGAAAPLQAEAAARGISDAVQLLGGVDGPTLLRLYAAAAVFAYPSRYEGFGLPVLEAMASGVPVVAARAGSLPEVVGDAGVLVDPDDEEGFASAIQAAVMDEAHAASLRAAGIARAASFTWDRTARETISVYRELVGPAPL